MGGLKVNSKGTTELMDEWNLIEERVQNAILSSGLECCHLVRGGRPADTPGFTGERGRVERK